MDDVKLLAAILMTLAGFIFVAGLLICGLVMVGQNTSVYAAQRQLQVAMIEAKMPAKKECGK